MESKGRILMQKYELGKLLGQGTFAKVYHARDTKTGASVAIKTIDKVKVSKVGMMDQIEREISGMRLVQHPNIVHLFEVMASKSKIYFVIEYVKGGELFNKMSRGKMREDAARKYFQQLISAVDFCHSRGVYHRDLKPENLLLDENGNLKISDFGLSALAESKRQDGLLHTACGTPAYVAPEVISRKGYDGAKADIWSCGVILFVMLAGFLPFNDSNLIEMYKKITKADYKCPGWIAPDARKLISKMLDPNPSSRISMSKLMRNSWYRKGLPSETRKATEATKGKKVEITEPVHFKAEMTEPVHLNAFDIISLSAGFDLSGIFPDANQKKELKFTSNQPANRIVSKLEELAKTLKMKVMKKSGGVLKFEGSKVGRKGFVSIDSEIFQIAPTFHVVEMKKASGDTLEYQKMVEEAIRPSLNDIVWTWQGDGPRHEQRMEEPEFQPSEVATLNDALP